MKRIFFLLVIIILIIVCRAGNNGKEIKPNVIAISKGTFCYMEYDSLKDPCGRHYYYLIDVKIINNSDSTIEFWATTCTTGATVVADTKELFNCINSCTKNGFKIIRLKPKQEFSLPVIFRSEKEIDFKVKIGFIYLNPKNINASAYFDELFKCRRTLENVIWSVPIGIGLGYNQPYEIR
ncbi:MAG: hypothetical protein ABSG89_09060 [Bacteroidales bacterium]|jgi:hypothetical protein